MAASTNPSELPQNSPRVRARVIFLPQSWKRKTLFVGIYLLFLMFLVWGGGRLFWKWKFGVPLTAKADVWDYYFPELRSSGVLDADVRPDDDVLDVVLLGASTLEKGWANIDELLLEALKQEWGGPIRVFNLAVIAHTSRDSLLKFSRIAGKPFDVVLIYDGFNDCRMNNCPPELFREDYTHCSRYASFEDRKRRGSIMRPLDTMNLTEPLIGLGSPDLEAAKFGVLLKTPEPFRQNLNRILELARAQGSLVVLNTFASHIPEDYTDEKLQRGEMDFGKKEGAQRCPLEMWGRKSDVVTCVRVHNEVIQQVAQQDPKTVLLIDQAARLSGDGQNFIDVCHFTDQGCRNFVGHVMAKLGPWVKARAALKSH
ncbi:MAG: hypothetical protein JWM11_362 [Planctomycetaceae bacterium]|nr:hypothetical protein [Planctomycetaceae bacterium]